MTTVSIGFFFTQSKYLSPHWLIFIWGSAIGIMCISLVWGILSIHHNLRALGISSTMLSLDDFLTWIATNSDESFRNSLKIGTNSPTSTTLPVAMRFFILQKLERHAKEKNMDLVGYIENINIDVLKGNCADGCYEFVGLKNETSSYLSVVELSKKSSGLLMRQLYFMSGGYFLFACWYVIKIIILK